MRCVRPTHKAAVQPVSQITRSEIAQNQLQTGLCANTRKPCTGALFSWRSTVDAYTEGMPVSENMPVHGYRVRVEVFWRGLAQARSVQRLPAGRA